MNAITKMPTAAEGGGLAMGPPVKEVYLHPGQLFVSGEPAHISMILGSCAGVCLYDWRQAIGGATHYMLPQWDGSGSPSARYGDVAIEALLQQLKINGSRLSNLEAKVFGGACMFQVFRDDDGSGEHLGSRNVNMAVETFSRLGIPIVAKDIGGENGRKLKMQSDTGSVVVSLIRNS